MKPLLDRLMARADESPSGCWLWRGTINDDGYGRFAVYERSVPRARDGSGRYVSNGVSAVNRTLFAHRLVYTELVGTIPDEPTLDHLCRVRHCVNPWHLEPVPRATNTLRGVGPTAANARKTECQHGHALTADNLYISRAGSRHCRACALRRAKESTLRKASGE